MTIPFDRAAAPDTDRGGLSEGRERLVEEVDDGARALFFDLYRLAHLVGLIATLSSVGVELCVSHAADVEDVTEGSFNRVVP